mmetsp:Transcript_29921/g.72525  ORF Transcript_29921/g.72525 Transcript_29921/m.72525 type:complete len:377 (+) Transcript_29921:1687-2817(+)
MTMTSTKKDNDGNERSKTSSKTDVNFDAPKSKGISTVETSLKTTISDKKKEEEEGKKKLEGSDSFTTNTAAVRSCGGGKAFRPMVKTIPLKKGGTIYALDNPNECMRRYQEKTDLASIVQKETKQEKKGESSSSTYDSDLVVVLDLDDTLLHLILPDSKLIDKNDEGEDDVVLVGPEVLFRPNLFEFLKETLGRYETHIFTAAEKFWAHFMMETLEGIVNAENESGTPPLSFTGCWYRDSCTHHRGLDDYVKDLNTVVGGGSDRRSRVVLVDDREWTFLPNPNNGIPIREFSKSTACSDANAGDTSLKDLGVLLRELEDVKDVRPALQERFGLKKVLDQEACWCWELFRIMVPMRMEKVKIGALNKTDSDNEDHED